MYCHGRKFSLYSVGLCFTLRSCMGRNVQISQRYSAETNMKPAKRTWPSSFRIALAALIVTWIFLGWESSQASSRDTQARTKDSAKSGAPLEIKVLSSRPDMVSGGDALVLVKAPPGTELSQITLLLNGKNVSNLLKRDAETGGFRGLVGGMVVGKNTLRATTKSGLDASLTVTNYPITGPILSGPHLSPYECRTAESGLGESLDSDCS